MYVTEHRSVDTGDLVTFHPKHTEFLSLWSLSWKEQIYEFINKE